MSIRTAMVRLPRSIPTAVGILLTTGLAALAVGAMTMPRWLGPSASRNAAGWEAAGDSADTLWRNAVQEIARARGVATAEALLGSELTPLVTTLGEIEAKRLSASPAWPRILTGQIHGAGIKAGDVVAASFSGSFPGLNIAVMSACQALDIRLIAVSSVTASSWGATDAGFTWPEMEARLVAAGGLHRVTVAVSAGGSGDRALDLEPEGRLLAREIAVRSARALRARLLEPASFDEAVRARLAVFDEQRAGRPLAAFINVGGTEASLGHSPAILRLVNGWLAPVPFDSSLDRGLVARMAEGGVPVLHLLNVRDLAVRWGVL
jgi:poly-gamma-glutamate system protein